MSDIFPAEDQSVSDVMAELTQLGLVDGQDFRLHWTWDMRPYVKAEPEAYKKWEAKSGKKTAASKDTKADDKSEEDADASKSGDEKEKSGPKRGGK